MRAKQEYFNIPGEWQERMQDAKLFLRFWQGMVRNKELLGPLHYAATVLLACCSSCDAERSISLLNCAVTALHNRMSWKKSGFTSLVLKT